MDATRAYEALALADIGQAADLMAGVYKDSDGLDGYVSLEVDPGLANDADGTIADARRLWKALDRPNIMIKVPVTDAGVIAIEELIADGININATLLFSVAAYEQSARAYQRGLHRLAAAGGDVSKVAGVASLFVSRVDSAVDKLVDARLAEADSKEQGLLNSVRGEVAIANAKIAYQRYKDLFSGDEWTTLSDNGARPQRLLWASTGVKDPSMRDVRYVEELIGPDTVNTVPPATLGAFRDHGDPRPSLEQGMDEAQQVIKTLDKLGIDLDQVTDELLVKGVEIFAVAFDKLLAAVKDALGAARETPVTEQYSLPDALQQAVDEVLADWRDNDKIRRLWARDESLWTGKDEARWLDWLAVSEEQLEHIGDLRRIGHSVEGNYFKQAVLLAMGGSSMGPEVIRRTFGHIDGFPDWQILDSTDPAQVREVADSIDFEHAGVLVSSKSGGTLEPNILKDYFFERMRQAVGDELVGKHFAAITDPGSALEHTARGDGFRELLYGIPSIGGRFSVLSNFGMAPAAAMGVDVEQLLSRASEMAEACAACVDPAENPGVKLGAVLGAAANIGRDKLTLVTSPGVSSIGAWMEQLVAESTGKDGKAIIPLDGEMLGAPARYGEDRLFVYLYLDGDEDEHQRHLVDRLEQDGQPVIRIALRDGYDLGREFFRWEMATAVACSVMGVNAFDQPDVEASKIATRRLTTAYEDSGALPAETPFFSGEGVKLYTDEANRIALTSSVGLENADATLADYIRAHLKRLEGGDYFAVLAYINRLDPGHDEQLQLLRHRIRDNYRVATCLGYGPRFLDSTGQAYKGGSNTGLLMQITCDEADDLPVPGHTYTFGVVKAAQAQGDFEVLAERERRVLRIHLGKDTVGGLATLRQAVEQAIG
jgi:transaldolase/glucose-6-phosphate isomerase